MHQIAPVSATLVRDANLRQRAEVVIPGGMYGHMTANARTLPAGYPQFYAGGEGAYVTDVDGNVYADYLCAFGPMLLGHRDPRVEAAARAQAERGDTLSGPSERMVELAELLTDTIAHADWAMLAKNGTDATSMAVRISRVATGRKRLLKATVAYHGANEWFTPIRAGVTDEDRANISEFAYNDIASLEEMVRAHSDDLAAIILTPFRHDTFVPQEDVDPAFARRARELATAHGAVLILDEVRTGFRLDVRGAWEGIGVRPDITAFSKAIANGHALSAITGGEPLREAAAQIYATGSFWYSAVPMAAGIATISAAREIDAPAVIRASGERLKAGFEAQAAAAGVPARLTGPTQMPLLVFEDDPEYAKAFAFTGAAIRHGVLMHPWHNMFLSTAHSFDVIDDTLERTQRAFDEMFLSTP